MDTPEPDPETPPPDGAGTDPAPRWDRRRTVGAIAGGAAVLGVIVLLVVGLANKDIGTSIQDALAAGERPAAPAVTLPVISAGDGVGPVGAEVSTTGFAGRIVVLNFWASWCEPCKAEAPVLESVARRYRTSKDVTVIGVDVQDLREKALGFIDDYQLTYPSLRDGAGHAQSSYQVPALPETFVIDAEGRIALKVAGQLTAPEQLTTAIGQLRREAS